MDVVELAVGPNDPPEAVAAVIEGHLRRGRAVACVTTVNRGNRRAPEAWTKALEPARAILLERLPDATPPFTSVMDRRYAVFFTPPGPPPPAFSGASTWD